MRRSLFSLAALAAFGLVVGGLTTPLTGPPPAHAATTELGYDRIGLRRGDTWLLRDSLDGGPARSYAEETAGWTPVAGDTDGDGTGTVHLFRDGIWLLRDVPQGARRSVHFGQRGDLPVIGDWDGDGVDSIGFFRGGRWYVRDNSAAGPTRIFGFGMPGDRPVVGDWDGNGRTDIAVVRGYRWYQRDAASTGASSRNFTFGLTGDRIFAGDWNHDGRDEPGVFRSGTWYFRESNFTRRYQTTRFGAPGDVPVIRRVPGLAAGVSHRVVRDPTGPFTAHVATIDLAAASTPDAVLSNNRLSGFETTSAMARRSGAVLAVNGDFTLSSGRPVHAHASDGELAQTEQLPGRAVAFTLQGGVAMGVPRVEVGFRPQPGTSAGGAPVSRWNAGAPVGENLSAYTAVGSGLEAPPWEMCYAGVAPVGSPRVHADGAVDADLWVTGRRCGGQPAAVPATGAVLVGNRFTTSEALLAGLTPGQVVQVSSLLGFPGAVDLVGGGPSLVRGGTIFSSDVDGSDGFFARHPRTGVGVTADGKLLLVVVDGRQPGYSVGMTLREFASLFQRLGAREAINLDGGGSSTMWLNGLAANRTSDGRERAVANSIVVLPGFDRGEAALTLLPASSLGSTPAPTTTTAGVPAPRRAARTLSEIATPGGAAAADAGSTGGYLQVVRRTPG